MLRSAVGLLVTAVSEQPVGPIFKKKEIHEGLDFLIPDDGDRQVDPKRL
jgi:hypothetical protein